MDSTLVTLTPAALAIVPVVMVLTSLAKNYVDSKWSPLVALVLSLLASFFLIPAETIALSTFQGIVLSLTASGLYSGGKVTAKALTE